MLYYQNIKDLKGNTVGINVYGEDKGKVVSEILRNKDKLKAISKELYLFDFSELITQPLKEAGFIVHTDIYDFRDLEDFLLEDLNEYSTVRIDAFRYRGLLSISNWHHFILKSCKSLGLSILYDYVEELEIKQAVEKAVKLIQPYDKIYLKGFFISKPVKLDIDNYSN